MPDYTVEEQYDDGQIDYSIYNLLYGCKHMLTMHYGIWEKDTKTLSEAHNNNNEYVRTTLGITKNDRILDAGCGVGGTMIWLASEHGLAVEGITISGKQVEKAKRKAKRFSTTSLTTFSKQDYTHTSFPDNTFDKIYGVESACHSPVMVQFVQEMSRILKKKGRLLLVDGYLSKPLKELSTEERTTMKQFCDDWNLSDPRTQDEWIAVFEKQGFSLVEKKEFTQKIMKTSHRAYILARAFYPLYRVLHYLKLIKSANLGNCSAAILQYPLFRDRTIVYGSILVEK